MERKYGTEIMKDEEVLLFVETAMENGSNTEEAIQDMKMIDTLLTAKRNHLLAFGSVKTTATGRIRKGTSLYNTLDGIVGARANGTQF